MFKAATLKLKILYLLCWILTIKNIASLAGFETLDWPTLISRKIWLTEKLSYFHTLWKVLCNNWKHFTRLENRDIHCTMLQKLSKCEVKAWLYLLYRHSDFTGNQILANSNSQKSHFGQFLRFSILILVNLSNFSSPNLPNFKVQNHWNCKKGNFGPIEFAKLDFK